jgi:hypothetical protein
MSRRGFWLGLLVGAVITGLLVATVMFVIVRFRWPAAAVYGLRGRQFGVLPRARIYPRLPSRSLGAAALLCGPLLLLAGALVVGLVLGRYWHSSRQDKVQPGVQASSVSTTAKAAGEAPTDTLPGHASSNPTAGVGASEAKS